MANLVKFQVNEELKTDVMKPLPRYSHNAVRYNRNIVIFGGGEEDVVTYNDDLTKCYSMRVIWFYDLDIDRWIKFVVPDTQNIPPSRISSCAVLIGSNIYMCGGAQRADRGFYHKGDLWKLSMTAEEKISWTQLTTTIEIAPRTGHTGWEYKNKLWIFGGFGPNIFEYLHDNETFQRIPHRFSGVNNQVCCFSPTEQKWMTCKSKGSKPSPRCYHGITKIRENIWLYGGRGAHAYLDDLYELHLRTLTWTQVPSTGPPNPLETRGFSPSLIALSNKEILFYGMQHRSWIIDVSSLSWRQHNAPTNEQGREEAATQDHTGIIGIHSVIIFGGQTRYKGQDIRVCGDVFHINFKPKSLLKSCVEAVYKHRSLLQCKWNVLPRNLNAQVRAMCEFSA